MKMNGVEHDMLMPGMLTDEEMAALDRARGPEFDRLFLVGMIKHHQGAIDMVDVLFKAYGAAQDETVFRFASDVYADQSTEIDRMNKMLEEGSPMRWIVASLLAFVLAGSAFGVAACAGSSKTAPPAVDSQHACLRPRRSQLHRRRARRRRP